MAVLGNKGLEKLGFKHQIDESLPENVIELRHPKTKELIIKIINVGYITKNIPRPLNHNEKLWI